MADHHNVIDQKHSVSTSGNSMYYDKIDDFILKNLDTFFASYIKNKATTQRLLSATNFVTGQIKINEIIEEYTKIIKLDEIKQIFIDEKEKGKKSPDILATSGSKKISSVIVRYLAYYIFMYIAYFYTGRREDYVNNVIEFTRNQISQSLKIDNFFDSENNAVLFKFFDLIKDTIFVLDIKDVEHSVLVTKQGQQRYSPVITLLNEIGEDYVNRYLKNQSSSSMIAHNLIKTIIIRELYIKKEKVEIIKILNEMETETGEYTYIEIVVPRTEALVNYHTIESILTPDQLRRGMANDVYNYLMDYQEQAEKFITLKSEQKIMELFSRGLIIPISDEFLRYHKDSEKYGREQFYSQKKKREDTFIGYAIGKIESASDLYNPQLTQEKKNNIARLFWQPLESRKVILMNEIEEIRSINKVRTAGRISIENLEYYNDLLHFRIYPYLNFKDFKKYGFSLQNSNGTINTMRYTNIEFNANIAKNTPVETRTSMHGSTLNIVGILIPKNNEILPCIRVNNLTNVNTPDRKTIGFSDSINASHLSDNRNGYNNSIIRIQDYLNGKNKKNFYWIFDPLTDRVKLESYEQINRLNFQDQIKIIMTQIYDYVINSISKLIEHKLMLFPSLSFYHGYKIINYYEHKFLSIKKYNPDLYHRLIALLYQNKYVAVTPRYDDREDQLMGVGESAIKLPTYQPPKKKQRELKISSLDQELDADSLQVTDATCQHFVDWDKITVAQRQSTGAIQELLYEFIQHYVQIASDGEYICKSCGSQVNIQKYDVQLSYDEDKGKYGILNMSTELNIENIPEYEKYNRAITIIDKIIEKIANVLNISAMIGTALNTKFKRRTITKNTIDLVVLHNTLLKKIYRKRNEISIKTYGLDKSLTIFFVFELDNSIFIYSSKEQDYYKQIKYNNILCYILFLILIDLNEQQILNLTASDKLCNWVWFEKYGIKYFEGLEILKNDKHDLVKITDYPVLCYLLYLSSCMFVTNNIWFRDTTAQEASKPGKKKMIDLLSQKKIIQTTVDLINSILEINTRKKKNYLYDIIATRFYINLSTLYNKTSIMQKTKERTMMIIKHKENQYIVPVTERKIKPISVNSRPNKIAITPPRTEQRISQTVPLRKISRQDAKLSSQTNCPDGKFHNWIPKGKTFECTYCHQNMDSVINSHRTENQFGRKVSYHIIRHMAEDYCVDKKVDLCSDPSLSLETIRKYEHAHQQEVKSINDMVNLQLSHLSEQKRNQLVENKQIIETYRKAYSVDLIDEFIKLVEVTLGKNINIENRNFYLRDDIFIINHDHLGNELRTPIIIKNSENVMKYRENHPYFKKNVIWYTNKKFGQIDIFYDAGTHVYLGYRESSKDFVPFKKLRLKKNTYILKILPSLETKLRWLGYSSKNIKISRAIKTYDLPISNKLNTLNTIINNVLRDRMQHLKKIIVETNDMIQDARLLYEPNKIYPVYKQKSMPRRTRLARSRRDDDADERVINRTEQKTQQEKLIQLEFKKKELVPTLPIVVNKYKKILETMRISEGKKKLFENINIMEFLSRNYLDVDRKLLEDIDLTTDNINLEKFDQFDQTNNLLLNYFVDNISNLIRWNTTKFARIEVTYMLITIINYYYDLFNTDSIYDMFDVRRFQYILNSSIYVTDLDQKFLNEDVITGAYGEGFSKEELAGDTERQEESQDEQEMFESIDMDGKMNYQQETWNEPSA